MEKCKEVGGLVWWDTHSGEKRKGTKKWGGKVVCAVTWLLYWTVF